MEYVVYLSKTKIDMLYEQIGEKPSNYSLEGECNIGFLKGKVSLKKNTAKNYYQKLERVISEIDVVNSIYDRDSKYITGTMSMNWGVLKYSKNATFWIGEKEELNCHSKVLLVCSSKHIIGNKPTLEGGHCSPLAYFMNAYAQELEMRFDNEKTADLHRDSNIRTIISTMKSYCELDGNQVVSNYKFLAKCLCQQYFEYNGSIENLIIASPLYVSEL